MTKKRGKVFNFPTEILTATGGEYESTVSYYFDSGRAGPGDSGTGIRILFPIGIGNERRPGVLIQYPVTVQGFLPAGPPVCL
jgi:hypothetical protein